MAKITQNRLALETDTERSLFMSDRLLWDKL